MASALTMTYCLFARSPGGVVQFESLFLKAQHLGNRSPESFTEAEGTMPSILVVDDEDQIRQLIRETLEQAGYHVAEARDGKEALDQYRLAPADVVIMDILMPEQDGLETTATLRREFPNVKVIAITGGSDMIGILNFLDVAKMLGAHRVLQKPFEMKTLLDTVQAELQD